jgi:hypothetical protein
MSATTSRRLRAAITVVAPAVLLAGFAYHPDVGNPTGADFTAANAAAVAADTTRWGLSHLAIGVGSGLLILAFLAIRSYLREAGEDRWSALALPFIVIGSTLFALLPAMEFAPLAAAEGGADLAGIEATQGVLRPWFAPILVTGAVTFLLGALGFATAIARSGTLSRPMTWLVEWRSWSWQRPLGALGRRPPGGGCRRYRRALAAGVRDVAPSHEATCPPTASTNPRQQRGFGAPR